MLVRLAIRLMLLAAVVIVALSLRPGASVAGATEIQLDTYRADNSHPIVATGPVLQNGQHYTITIAGTFSYWPASQWQNQGVCVGSAEDMPMFPSPGTTNGKVGVDPAWHFAAPGDAGDCSSTYPRIAHVEISLDGGATSAQYEADDVGTAPDPSHTYHYSIVGQGEAVVFSFEDSKTVDNYGILKFTIEPVPLTWGDNDCLGGIAALDALPTLVHGFGIAGPQVDGGGCPDIGQSLDTASFGTRVWGDLDCSGYFDAPDVLLILRYVADLPPANLQDCPALGITVALAPI